MEFLSVRRRGFLFGFAAVAASRSGNVKTSGACLASLASVFDAELGLGVSKDKRVVKCEVDITHSALLASDRHAAVSRA